eukprot:7762027-Alexandrium_andersonii.AAC.1
MRCAGHWPTLRAGTSQPSLVVLVTRQTKPGNSESGLAATMPDTQQESAIAARPTCGPHMQQTMSM